MADVFKYREVRAILSARIPDSADAGANPDRVLLNGYGTAHPKFRGGSVVFSELGEFAVPRDIPVRVVDGHLMTEVFSDDEVILQPLFLPVTVDERANQNWSYQLTFDSLTIGDMGEQITHPPLNFPIEDGEGPLELSTVATAVVQTGTFITRGERGYSVTSVTGSGGVIVFEWGDGETTSVPMPSAIPGPPPTVEWDGHSLVVGGVAGPDLRGPNAAPSDEFVAGTVADSGSLTGAALRSNFVEGRADEDQAPLGAELITSSGWTLGDGWSGSFGEGFTHTPGSTSELTWTPPSSPAGTVWVVQWTITAPDGTGQFPRSDVDVYFGGGWAGITYQGAGLVGQYSRAIRATTNSPLRFAPLTTFRGRIHDISIRPVGAPIGPVSVWRDSSGAVTNEARMSGQENFFLGRDAGRYVSEANNPARFNTIVGNNAGAHLVTGFFNTAVGERGLNSVTSGTRNVALGYRSLESVEAGDRNVAVGPFAGAELVNGQRNVMVGVDVLYQTTTASDNIGMGYLAMHAAGEIHQNIALGGYAMGSATDGAEHNVSIGYMALRNASGGRLNIALGRYALLNSSTGEGNVAVGSNALLNATTPSGLVAIGSDALVDVTTNSSLVAVGDAAGRRWRGSSNVMVGTRALQGVSGAAGGERNTVMGYQAGYQMQSGSRNTLIGSMAGWSLVDGSDNILIGNAVNTNPAASGSNRLNIGNTIFGDMAQNKVGIGTAAPTARLHLPAGGTGPESAPLKFTSGPGGLMTTPEPGAFEYSGGTLYFTSGDGIRRAFAFQE